MLPNLIGIGSHRCGTTWIYEKLKPHSQVYLSPEKEINFFSTNYGKGLKWYGKFFTRCSGQNIIGEISPSYLSHPQCAQRIHDTVPEVKLVASLRNPLEQVYSRYHYMVTRQLYGKPFHTALEEHPQIIDDALYHKHLRRYFDLFDKKDILVLIYDDLTGSPSSFLKRIYTFLDLDHRQMPDNVEERVHSSRVPRSRHLESIMVSTRIVLRKLGLFPLVETMKKSGIVQKFKSLNTSSQPTISAINPELAKELSDVFSPDIERLASLLGVDLGAWT